MLFGEEQPQQRARLGLLSIGLAVMGIFVIAAFLNPDSRGFGTHEQMGFPPCQFKTLTGLKCPHCGMTTGFTHFVRGQFRKAWQSNPAVLMLAPLLIGTAVWCFIVAGTGRWLWTSEPIRWLIFGGIGFLLTTVLLWVARLF